MVKMRVLYRCTQCAADQPKWAGRCGACGAWNSLVEDVDSPEDAASIAAALAMSLSGGEPARRLTEIDTVGAGPQPTGMSELDRVLGGGLVPGSVTLLGGEPGIGKSTLLLQLLGWWPGTTLYVSAEESTNQVRLRAERLGVVQPDVWLLSETTLARIVDALDTIRPSLVVIDSIQTVADHEVGSAPGSVVQVRGCAQRLVVEAKRRNVPIVLVGHVTKEGGLAGPRVVEHIVDTVLSFEGDRHHALRLLRAVKHRFGPTSELGVFEMVESGLIGVPDASRLLLSDRRTGIAGSAITPTLDGQRPLLVEVQALTIRTSTGGFPRRSAQGIDAGRLALLLAVLERRVKVGLSQDEVFVSAVGGVRLTEPGADVAVSAALVSAVINRPIPPDVVVFGEVGLAGELRQVAHAQRRLAEAARLGFARAVVPANSANGVDGIQVLRVATVAEAMAVLDLSAR